MREQAYQDILSEERVRFEKGDASKRTIIFPNLFPEFSEIMLVALEKEGYKGEIVEMAGPEAVALGKKYVHNDICFPAQLNVGEILHAINTNKYKPENVAVGLSKRCNACRALQYYALIRKGLDESGYKDIPVVTNGTDPYDFHPGFKMGIPYSVISLQGLTYLDAIMEMKQKILPYEKNAGETESVFKHHLSEGMKGLRKNFKQVKKALREAVKDFNQIPCDRSVRKPVVGIVGEIMVNYNHVANYNTAKYLLDHGLEVMHPPILDFFIQEIVNYKESARHKFSRYPVVDHFYSMVWSSFANYHLKPMDKIMQDFRFYEKKPSIQELGDNARDFMEIAFNSGEGWLLPGEIVAMIKKGIYSFIIVQPFGCLPNHISGRGLVKAIKEKYPFIQILSLDFDPDISTGNIENRLQMLILTARELVKRNQNT